VYQFESIGLRNFFGNEKRFARDGVDGFIGSIFPKRAFL